MFQGRWTIHRHRKVLYNKAQGKALLNYLSTTLQQVRNYFATGQKKMQPYWPHPLFLIASMQCRTVHGAFASLYLLRIRHTLQRLIFCVSSAISLSLNFSAFSVITSDVRASTHSAQLHLNILSSVSPNLSSTSASTSLYTCCFSLFIIVEIKSY